MILFLNFVKISRNLNKKYVILSFSACWHACCLFQELWKTFLSIETTAKHKALLYCSDNRN